MKTSMARRVKTGPSRRTRTSGRAGLSTTTILFLLGVAALLLPTVSSAQEKQIEGKALGDMSEEIDVDLVTLEVFVSDRKGRPTEELTASDFMVKEDGKEVDILSFRSLSNDGAEDAVRSATVVVYLDESLLLPTDLARISGSLARFIEGSLPPGVGLVLARHGDSLEVILPHSTSPKDLVRALETIVPTDGAVANEQSIARAVERIDLEKRLFSENRAPGIFAEDSVPCTSGWAVVVAGARAHAAEASDRLGRSITSLARLISGLSGIPGRKSLLYVSGGLQMRPGTEVFTSLADLCPDRQLAVATLLQEYQQVSALYALAAHANANRVTLYPFDGAGVDTGQDGSRAFFETRSNLNESLNLLGEETGGRAVLNANIPDRALSLVSQDLRDYYEISYRPNQRRPAANHLINVALRNLGRKQLRFRRTVRAKSTEDKLTERLVSTLLLGLEDNPLGIHAELGEAQAAAGRRVRVPVRLRVPRESLFRLRSDERPRGALRLFLMARDSRNRGSEIKQHVIHSDELVENGDSFEFVIEMELNPAEYIVALGVRDEITWQTSYLRLQGQWKAAGQSDGSPDTVTSGPESEPLSTESES